MLPDHQEQLEVSTSAPGTPPPQSPARGSNGYRRMSTGKEEDAVESLMQLATPVKSPRGGGGGGDTLITTPGTGSRGTFSAQTPAAPAAYGAEMTPVSLFRKSRHPGEIGQQLHSPFLSPFQSFNFSPGCLFSPPAGGGTLDIPTGDTPGRSNSARDALWREQVASTPERTPREPRGETGGSSCTHGSAGGGSGSGVGGGRRGNNIDVGDAPGSCGKRKGKALFTDRRGPQDHSRLGQAWCLGTPGRSCSRGDASSAVHHPLSVTNDIPATPDRVPGVNGASVLPPTPQLLPPTPPPRGSREAEEAAVEAATGRGDDAAGILMGLRSPEGSSAFMSGSGNIAHSLFAGLDENYDGPSSSRVQSNSDGAGVSHGRGDHSRGWSDDWSDASGGESGSAHGGLDSRGGHGGVGGDERLPPHSAPSKRYRRWASPSISLRNSHCKGSFKIEGMTLIRTGSVSSATGTGIGGGGGVSSSSGPGAANNSSSNSSNSITVTKREAVGAERGSCRVRSRGQSIADESLSPPPKALLSPEGPALAMARRSVSLSPAPNPPTSRGRGGASSSSTTIPNSGIRPSARSQRADRSRRGASTSSAVVTAVTSVTPSPAPRTISSKPTPSKSTPLKTTSSKATSGMRSTTTATTTTTTITITTPSISRSLRTNGGPSCTTPSRSPALGAAGTLKTEPVEASSYHSPEPTSMRRGRAALVTAAAASASVPAAAATTAAGARASPTLIFATTPGRGGGNIAVRDGAGEGEGRHPGGEGGTTTCNCKKSKCLKLYCECFQRKQYCTDCNCKDCCNTPLTEAMRQGAIQSTIERNPSAFVSKFEKRAGGKRAHNAGCNCKKSACLKKYCECFQAGVACGTNCKCSNCKNYEGAAGGRKRRAPDPSVASQVAQPPRTPPRSASKARRNGGLVTHQEEEVKMATIAASPDSYHVQVGGDEDEDDHTYSNAKIDVKTNLLVDALSEGAANPTVSSTTASGGISGISNGGGGSGGGDPSDTPPSTAAVAPVAAIAPKRAASPAAAAVADCAVPRSVLDMGGTPLQLKGKESGEDRGFELSVVTGSPGTSGGRGGAGGLYISRGGGGRCGTDNAGSSSDDEAAGVDGPAYGGFGDGGARGLREVARGWDEREKAFGGGIGALARCGAREGEMKKGRESMDVVERKCTVEDVQEERAGDGNGGLVASGESKAGGQCLTPPTPANATNDMTWKPNKIPGSDVGPATVSATEGGSAGGEAGTCGVENNPAATAASTLFVI